VDHDARVRAQLPGELAVADVDGVDPRGAVLEQDVGEAAGGGADVGADQAGWRKREVAEGVVELQSATGDPGMILAADFEGRVFGEGLASFLDAPGAGEDLSCEDEGLGAGAAFNQAAIGEQDVGTDLRRLTLQGWPSSSMRSMSSSL